MKRPNILVVGSINIDMICSSPVFPKSGETVIGNEFNTAFGGKGANQAVQAARLGALVSFAGKVGNDTNGKAALENIKNEGIDVSGIAVSDKKSTGVAVIMLEEKDGKTENRILVLPGTNMEITEEDIECINDKHYDMIMLQLEIPMEICEAVAEYGYRNNKPVMLNSAPSAPLSDELLSHLTYISPNEHEAEDITGVKVTDENSAKEAIDIFLKKGVKNVLITMGSRGAAFGNKDMFVLSKSVDFDKVVDPTAAGDSFVAAFCTAVCMGVDVEKALTFANYTAGITVCRMGAQPSLPHIDDVISFMRSHGHNTDDFETLSGGIE